MQGSDNVQMRLDPSNRICISGLPGSGKTTLMRWLAAKMRRLPDTEILIYDTLDQYRGFNDRERYVPRDPYSMAEFERVCAYLCRQRHITFLIEEAHRFIGQWSRMGPNAADLINRGRNWGNGVYAATTRIQGIQKEFFDNCQHCYFFKCGLTSRRYIQELAGPEVVREIEKLPQHAFVYYSVTTDKFITKRLDLPKSINTSDEKSTGHELRTPDREDADEARAI